jgi:hypothetical protein
MANVFYCSKTAVLSGPYNSDSIKDQLRGQRWCREVMGAEELYVVTADTLEQAKAALGRHSPKSKTR